MTYTVMSVSWSEHITFLLLVSAVLQAAAAALQFHDPYSLSLKADS